MQSTRETPPQRRSRRRKHPLSVFAVVDGDKIPPRCFGEPVRIAASDGRGAKAFDALCRMLRRNRQVGITAVALDGATRLAALVPIGNALAVSLLQPDYQRALTDGLRPAA
jgi:non-homologous end joining protein Ku